MSGLARRLMAEALGTALLVATVVGSGIMATRLSDDQALQLLGNTLPTGAILVVLITIFAPVSGAHFNPAVSLVMAIRRELSVLGFIAYTLAQCAGAVAGTMIAHVMFEQAPLVIGTTARNGVHLWVSEGVATFTLVIAILGTLRARPDMVPIVVGLTITAAYWFTSSTSFANPAVTLARGFTTSFSGIALSDVPTFVVVQFAGAVLGLMAAALLFSDPKVKANT
ncbi:MAG TPA: aquaporin family protein [Alphaproteobacteria bacterium]|nr:aquaporin family protein [Alphaproteobacteria bacterium]HAJ48418.1 aquaporin family protein [Alphaproteobacteria bacterium]